MRCLLLCGLIASMLGMVSACGNSRLPPDADLPKEIVFHLGGGVALEMVRIDPGEFLMGFPADEKERPKDETQRAVEITQPFYMGKYEVTQKQYTLLTSQDNPSFFSSTGGGREQVKGLDTSRFPVEQVTWHDAAAFCATLNRRHLSAVPGMLRDAGYKCGLPTEAQWEYSCRAGTTSPFHFGSEVNGTQANCDASFSFGLTRKGPSLRRTCEVGSHEPNAFGLYDMHGNAWEWCSDWYSRGTYKERVDPEGPKKGGPNWKLRVVRGGGWMRKCTGSCRSAVRNGSGWDRGEIDLGFRVALIPPSRRGN
jgi:formylglycine-generating enzyme required for sulfatase activity